MFRLKNLIRIRTVGKARIRNRDFKNTDPEPELTKTPGSATLVFADLTLTVFNQQKIECKDQNQLES